MKKYLLTILLFIAATTFLDAQTWHQITPLSGNQTFGSNTVTVSSIGLPVPGPQYYSCYPYGAYYRIGTNAFAGYNYQFAGPVNSVRVQVVNLDGYTNATETIRFDINGVQYMLSPSDVSMVYIYPMNCPPNHPSRQINNRPTIANGKLVGTVVQTFDSLVQIDIQVPGGINSLALVEEDAGTTGYNLFIPDTSVYINKPFNDTLFCPGNSFSLAYSTQLAFGTGNTFTAQLSDANGSFASPTNIGTATATTAGTIPCTIPMNTPAGTDYRIRILGSTPARISDTSRSITIKARPQALTAAANSVCAGQTLNLSASASPSTGITWAWTGPNAFSSSLQNPSIANAATTATGDYILTATLTATGCTAKDTAAATVSAVPQTPVTGNSGPVCAGSTINLTANSFATGITYNWTGPNGYTATTQNPVITNTTTGNSGVYTVTASAGLCTSLPAATTVTIKPVPATPVITGNSPVCLGTELNLQATSTPGSSYNWTGPNGYTSNAQNIVIDPATKAHAGGYGVVASLNGCNSLPATYLVQVNTVASTGAYASPNDTICPGATVQFVAFAKNAGTAPAFQWYRNGIPETTTPVFTTSNIAHGDRFWCSMTATGVCATPLTIVTDTIRMAVVPMTVTPSVMITALPGVHIRPGTLITFTAYMQNGGFAPKYQWKKNGVNVGVTTATWATDKLLPGDAITVELESNDHCASPKTATSAAMHIGFPLGIDGHNAKGISLYPNPNAGSFTISGIADARVQAEVINALGQTVYTKQHIATDGSITLQTALPAGAYLLRLYTGSNVQVLRFSITK